MELTIDRYETVIERLLPRLGDDPTSYDAALVRPVLLECHRPPYGSHL